MSFVVRCSDGAQRHRDPFPTRRLADEFSWWGHCCTSEHEIISLETPCPHPTILTPAP